MAWNMVPQNIVSKLYVLLYTIKSPLVIQCIHGVIISLITKQKMEGVAKSSFKLISKSQIHHELYTQSTSIFHGMTIAKVVF